MERMQHLKKYSDRLSRKGSRRSTEKARANTSRGNPRNTEKKKYEKQKERTSNRRKSDVWLLTNAAGEAATRRPRRFRFHRPPRDRVQTGCVRHASRRSFGASSRRKVRPLPNSGFLGHLKIPITVRTKLYI